MMMAISRAISSILININHAIKDPSEKYREVDGILSKS